MRTNVNQLRIYKNQFLMDETNEMFIRIKVHLFELNKGKLNDVPKPTVQELDQIMSQVMLVLRQDSKPMGNQYIF